jgi:hypothetical protein
MRAVARRIARLEDRLGPADGTRFLLLVSRAGQPLALTKQRCTEILDESGYLPTGTGFFSLVMLSNIPCGLNAEELERYLREHGGELSPNGRASARPPAAPTSAQAWK